VSESLFITAAASASHLFLSVTFTPQPNSTNLILPSHTDAEDESLRKWKASLGIGAGTPLTVDPSDKRRVVMISLGLEVKDRADIIINLSEPGAVENLKNKPFTIKEGAEFRMKISFRVQHQVLSGMKYLQVVKKMGISSKVQEMIGSYAPSTKETPAYEKKCMYILC